MSNTVFRKGLVAAAIAGLAATAFAGTPAFADANVLFVPTTGTGNTLISGETFSLTASLGSLVPADKAPNFKFKVDSASGAAATVKINGKTLTAPTSTTGGSYAAGTATVALTPSGNTAGSTWTTSTTSAVFGLGADYNAATGLTGTTNYAAATASAIANGSSPVLTISSDATKAADYTVTAFLDTNNNGVIDSGEFATSQAVHFVTVANSGITTTFTKPVQNSTALSAKVSFSNADMNLSQMSNTHFAVAFGLYGVGGRGAANTNANFAAGSVAGDAVSFSSTNNNYATSGATATSAPAAGATYSAQAIYNLAGVSTVSSNALVGAEAVQVVAASTDADATPLAVKATASDNVKQTADPAVTWSGATPTGHTGAYNVRSGVTSTSVNATIYKTPSSATYSSTSGVAVGAGVQVNVLVTSATAAIPSGSTTADTLNVAGVNLVLSGSSQNVNNGTVLATLTTDATGKVTVPVTSSLGTANDAVTVQLQVVNAVSTAVGSSTLTWTAAALVAPVEIFTGSATHTIVKGSNVALKYALTDSYGALSTSTSYQLLVTALGINSSTTTATPVNVYVPFVNGYANVSFTDNSLAAGSNAVTLQIQKNVNGAWVTDSTNLGSALNTWNLSTPGTNLNVVASVPAAAAVSASPVNNTDLAGTGTTANATGAKAGLDIAGTYVSGDPKVAGAAFAKPAVTAGSVVKITGNVTDASGVGVAGAPVTVALKGAQFASGVFDNSGSVTVYATDSITVNSGTDGSYTVYVATHTAGTNSVVVTSGAATKTISVYVAAATTTTAGKDAVLVVTAPAYAAAGTTINFSALLTDKFGNPVAVVAPTAGTDPTFSLKASGVGNVVINTASATDSTGVSTGYATVGAADSGSLVITATYNYDGTTAASTKTATATVKVGAAAVAALTSVAAQAQAQTGSAVSVTATAKDAAGNAIKGAVISFTATGAGYLSAATATTDANGVATVKLIGNVAGANSVVASANGTSAAAVAVTFGQSDASLSVAGHRVTAAWSYAAGKKVVITRDGVRIKSVVASDDAADSFSFNVSKKGTHKVTVSVAGVVTDVITVK